ncbi:7tm 6 domain containing protein, partial [Asbolus verrucosus]
VWKVLTFKLSKQTFFGVILEGNVDVSEDLAILAALFGYKSIMVLYVFKQRKLQTLMWKLSDFTKLGKPPHFDELKSMILECFDEGKFENRRRLNMCIRYHLDIIEYFSRSTYSKRLNDCFTNEMFIHLTTTGIICGCLENQIVKGYNFGTVLHILAWIGALAVSCFGGQMLMDSSLSVADVMYCSKWYEADVHLRKYAILMMVRSQKPLYVTTGSFGVLTLPLFV